jgi:hypothetical protein
MVILEEETFKKFGYYPRDLTPKSHKKILVACDACGKIREVRKDGYSALCKNCVKKSKYLSEETRKKLTESNIGNKYNLGKHLSEETRKKISEAKKGEKNYSWKGGISFEPYCPRFNNEFKEYIRNKFGRICFLCGKTEEENGKKLCVHHVNYDKNCGCAETDKDKKADDKTCQFVPLCNSCNSRVNTNRNLWELRIKNEMKNKLNGWYI